MLYHLPSISKDEIRIAINEFLSGSIEGKPIRILLNERDWLTLMRECDPEFDNKMLENSDYTMFTSKFDGCFLIIENDLPPNTIIIEQ